MEKDPDQVENDDAQELEQVKNFDIEDIFRIAKEKYPKKCDIHLQYCNVGFRTKASLLYHVAYRMGVLAVLKSKQEKATVGVMITASHYPETENGFQLIGPRGDYIDLKWMTFATELANAGDDDCHKVLTSFASSEHINLDVKANVFIGFDTRPSSKRLSEALQTGIANACGEVKNFELVTTPELFYLVQAFNKLGPCKESSAEGYNSKLIKSFSRFHGEENVMDHLPSGTVLNPIIRNLINRKQRALKKWGKLKKLEDRAQLREIERRLKREVKKERQRIGLVKGNCMPDLFMDCASGVGAVKMGVLAQRLSKFFNLSVKNDLKSDLNERCGAHYVRTNMTFPRNFEENREGQRCFSIDGDADCVIYFYCTKEEGFVVLDGNKIGALIASHIKKLLRESDLELRLGFVQTGSANGNSTLYIKDELKIPVMFSPPGAKHMRQTAHEFDIGVYFDSSGHGSVVYSQKASEAIREKAIENNPSAKSLESLMELSNQVHGDAIGNFLSVEGILLANGWSAQEWNAIYKDLPSREMNVNVCDKNMFEVSAIDKKLASPENLQGALDFIASKYPSGRWFVRPAGNENVVRVYAEAESQQQADELVYELYLKIHSAFGVKEEPVEIPSWEPFVQPQPNVIRNLMDIKF